MLVDVVRKIVPDFERLGFTFCRGAFHDFHLVIGNVGEDLLRTVGEENGPERIMLFDDFADGVFDFGNSVLRFDFKVIMRVVLAEFKVLVSPVQVGELNACHREFSAFAGFARIRGGKRIGGSFGNNHVFDGFGKVPSVLCIQNGNERDADAVFLVNALRDSLSLDGIAAKFEEVETAIDFLELENRFPDVDNHGLRFGEDYCCFGFSRICCGRSACGEILHKRFAVELSVGR